MAKQVPHGKRFQPGQSGNPAGRPKADFAAYCRKAVGDGKDLADFWKNIMDATPESKKRLGLEPDDPIRMQDRTRASELLALRAFGQPETAVELSGVDAQPVVIQVVTMADSPPEEPKT